MPNVTVSISEHRQCGELLRGMQFGPIESTRTVVRCQGYCVRQSVTPQVVPYQHDEHPATYALPRCLGETNPANSENAGMRLWLLNALLILWSSALGAAIAWWLRGRYERATGNDRTRLVKDAMQGLQECTAKIRTRIAAHTDRIERIEAQLQRDGEEKEELETVSSSIIQANKQIHRQLAEVEEKLKVESEIIGRSLQNDDPQLLFTKSLDRKKRLYNKVLSSLELLASELAADVNEHRERMEDISDELALDHDEPAGGIAVAVGEIMDTTAKMQQRIQTAEKRMNDQADQLAKQSLLAQTDELTGLSNRRSFDRDCNRAGNEFQTSKKPFSVLMIDVDHFKTINDSHGHQAGDGVLRQLGDYLRAVVRTSDIAARYGGEEFSILLHGIGLERAKEAAEKIRRNIEARQFVVGNQSLQITISVGVSSTLPGESSDQIVHRADAALYCAKEAGRNKTYWHDGCASRSLDSHLSEQDVPEPVVVHIDDPVEEESTQLTSEWTGLHLPDETDGAKPAQLSSRFIFCTSVNRRIAEWQRGGEPVSVILLSVEQTAEILQEYGSKAGDSLRNSMACLLATYTRSMDEPCEYDSDTYGVLLPGTDMGTACGIAERLREGIGKCEITLGGASRSLSVSVGVAHVDSGDSGMGLIKRAEQALMAAAQIGGDAVLLADRSGIHRPNEIVNA